MLLPRVNSYSLPTCGQCITLCLKKWETQTYRNTFAFNTNYAHVCMHVYLLRSTGPVCVYVCRGPVHVSELYIMDEFAAASRSDQAGHISKRLEHCYLYRELEGLQEQQEEEEEQEPLVGTATPPYHSLSTTQVHVYM